MRAQFCTDKCCGYPRALQRYPWLFQHVEWITVNSGCYNKHHLYGNETPLPLAHRLAGAVSLLLFQDNEWHHFDRSLKIRINREKVKIILQLIIHLIFVEREFMLQFF